VIERYYFHVIISLVRKMKSAEAIRLAIKNKLVELTKCTVLTLEIYNKLVEAGLLMSSDYQHLCQLTVSVIVICIIHSHALFPYTC